MTHRVTLKTIENVTHDVNHLVFERPDRFDFSPGQACELTLTRDAWTEEGRPFTMVSPPDVETVEFVIKSYPDHDGVTEQIATLRPGEDVTLSEPFGAIKDKGPGVFVAGGAGITPFIPILRARARNGALGGCHLVFANKAERDIILREEWENMRGLETLFLTDRDDGLPDGPIDANTLADRIDDSTHVYICGPQGLVDAVRDAARSLGHPEDRIVTEEGW